MKIAVIGSGSWGTAITKLLSEKGHAVTLWSYFKEESENLQKNKENIPFLPGVRLPDSVRYTNDIHEAVKDAEIVVTASPSNAIRNTVKMMKGLLLKDAVIVNISKGLEEGSHLTLSQVILEELPGAAVCVLSGPSHAEEVGRGLPTTNVVACSDMMIAKMVQDVFMDKVFRVYTNPDVLGVELGGSLKNVIALCAGISDGLGFGDNTKAALMTRGIAEITRLGKKMGARVGTFAGLSGIGDLIVTCTSMHSRNRRAGILIGEGKTRQEATEAVKMVVEGINTAKAGYELSQIYNVSMPITEQAYLVLFEGKNPKEAVMDLMTRSKTHEMEEVVSHNLFNEN